MSGGNGSGSLWVLAAGLAVGAGVFVLVSVDEESPPPPSAAPAPLEKTRGTTPDDVAALLGGLRVGDELDGFKLAETRVTDDHQLELYFDKGENGFKTVVRHKNHAADPAPRETEKYDIFVGDFRSYEGKFDPNDANDVVLTITERIKKTETTVAVPQGM